MSTKNVELATFSLASKFSQICIVYHLCYVSGLRLSYHLFNEYVMMWWTSFI